MFTLEKNTTSNWKSNLLSQETRKRSNKIIRKEINEIENRKTLEAINKEKALY